MVVAEPAREVPSEALSAPSEHLLEITSEPNNLVTQVRELWNYRELLFVLAARDIKVRYKQTVFGVAWAIFQPFISMVLFSVVFGRLAGLPSDDVPYPVFVYAGLLPWTFFSASLSSSANSLVSVSGLLTKVYFPRLLVPLAPLGAHLLDFVVATSIIFGLLLFFDVPLTLNLLALPLLVIAMLLVATGIGAMLSAVMVRFRDLRIVLPYGLQVLMFASPVVWAPSLVPENLRWVLYLNPLAGLIDGFRSSFLGRPFHLDTLAISGAVALLLFVVGMFTFMRFERHAVDVL